MENGAFQDIDYARGTFEETFIPHTRRLRRLVFYEVEELGELSSKTTAAFDFLTYTNMKITSTNWWLHVIGYPIDLWPVIFGARNHLSPKTYSDFINRYFIKTKAGPVWNLKDGQKISGGNLGPRMTIALIQHFLMGDFPLFVSQMKDQLYQETVLREPFEGNGMRADGCLHQHNIAVRQTKSGNGMKIYTQVYNNNYGKEFLKNAAFVMWILDGTKFDLGEEIEEGIFASFLECQQWLYRYTTVEPSTVGRFIDSGERVTKVGGVDAVLKTLEFLLKVDRHQHETISALHRYENPIPRSDMALIGNRYFFTSDLMAHQRQGFMATLRLLSKRTCRPETIKGEGISKNYYIGNAKGYYKGDGFLTIMVTGIELGTPGREVFQNYDWARIPGVTCLHSKIVNQVSTNGNHLKHNYNDADFVGGVSNGFEGLAGMIYNRPTVSLKARKSWFFGDNIIICLGSGINLGSKSTTKDPVITTINQVIYEGSHWEGYNGRKFNHVFDMTAKNIKTNTYSNSCKFWIHHSAIGYVPLKGCGPISVEVSRKTVSDKDYMDVLSIWLDHGNEPLDAEYAYAILPGTTETETEDFAREPSVQIIQLSQSIHALCLNKESILGAVFFDQGCVSLDGCITSDIRQICTDKPSMLLIKVFSNFHLANCSDTVFQTSKPSVLQISVSDPTQKLKSSVLIFHKGEEFQTYTVHYPRQPRAGDTKIICVF